MLGVGVLPAAPVTIPLAPDLTLTFTTNATSVQVEVTNGRGTWLVAPLLPLHTPPPARCPPSLVTFACRARIVCCSDFSLPLCVPVDPHGLLICGPNVGCDP